MKAKITQKGFTLIELLIVIGIIAILAAVVLLTLNPAELLRQARDATRISDLDALRSAIALYLVDVTGPTLGTDANCYVPGNVGGIPVWQAGCDPDMGATFGVRFTGGVATPDGGGDDRDVDSSGWIPVNFGLVSTGSPIPALPIDPTNSIGTAVGSDYFYAYRNLGTNYEINANLESTKFSPREVTDGGNAATFYEVGTDQGLDL